MSKKGEEGAGPQPSAPVADEEGEVVCAEAYAPGKETTPQASENITIDARLFASLVSLANAHNQQPPRQPPAQLPPQPPPQASMMVAPVAYMPLGKESCQVTCPFCQQVTITRVRQEVDENTLAMVILVLFLFFPLFWLPLVMPDCKSSEHYCTCCNRLVGKVKAFA